MCKSMNAHNEWCVVRYADGKFERAREGYKSAENARKGIPSVAREYLEKGGSVNAAYTVGMYQVGQVVVLGGYQRFSA